jgi:hypothetical protein
MMSIRQRSASDLLALSIYDLFSLVSGNPNLLLLQYHNHEQHGRQRSSDFAGDDRCSLFGNPLVQNQSQEEVEEKQVQEGADEK